MPYAELHCKTNFSFLRGASHPEEMVGRAAELGYAALAVTDVESLAGVVRAHGAAKDVGLKLIVGAEVVPADGPPLVLWAMDRAGYGRLARMITLGRRRAVKGECELRWEDVAEYAEGLLAGVMDCKSPLANCKLQMGACREVFGDRCYLLAELHRGPDDARRLAELIEISRRSGVPLLAAGDVRYHSPARMPLFDVLTAVRHGTTVPAAEGLLLPNAQRHLKKIGHIETAFELAPDAVQRTVEVADRCSFSLDELRYEYPEELAPKGLTPLEHLERLTWQGARQRYPGGVPDKVRGLLEHELALIEELRYEAYFLTVWDLVRFARSREILCQGRGSAANSAVCYCLGVTAVDPEKMDVLFERFVSRERNEAPDIDVDFEHERREEVLQYLYEKYGRERAGIAAEVITYRSRSAIRDVAKALGFSLGQTDALAKQVEGYAHEPKLKERCRQVGIDPETETGRRLVYLVNELISFPRHLSQHVGGMVITRGPLCELVPIENAAMEGRTVIQWNKDDLDELGILKVDCLGLGMLTAIRKCFELLECDDKSSLSFCNRSIITTRRVSEDPTPTEKESDDKSSHSKYTKYTLSDIPPDDPDVYDMICRADTMGVFQIESRAQMSMLPRLKPRCYYDLVIEVAIVRPGPIQGQMVHPYLRRRAGREPVTYPNDEVRAVLEKTLGVPIFQEQAMRLAVVAAGFTPGEADQLRRAMGAWRRPGVIDQFRHKLIAGMLERGLSQQFAEQVFQQIRGFGEYGFPESHAASFAQLVYVSAWLKHHHPAAFTAALLNSQPMGFYAPAQLVRDARDHGVEVRPVDVNHSRRDCTLELSQKSQPALRLGLRLISGLPTAAATTIEQAQTSGPFTSWQDFTRRTKLPRPILMRLAGADAFTSLTYNRRQALWQALDGERKQKRRPHSRPLLNDVANEEPPPSLPPLDLEGHVLADYQTIGLSLRAHPVSFYRQQLNHLGVTPAAKLKELPNGRQVKVAGLVLLRQRPSTAKGITFVTLEDETGTTNLVVHQATWDHYYPIARRSAAWLACGKLQSSETVIHVVVERLEDLSQQLGEVKAKSRDFR